MEFSNSPLVSYKLLSPHNSGTRIYPISRITPHHVVGLMSVEALGKEFNGTRQASSNYGIGPDGRIGLYVPESNRAWTSGSWDNDQKAVTIECADSPTYPYVFPDVVYERLIELCVDICRRNGKDKLLWLGDKEKTLAYQPAENEMVLTMHKWLAATACPGKWMEDHMGDLAQKVTAELQKNEPDNTPAKWAAEDVAWAVESGILVGDSNGDLMLRTPLTTERFCVMLHRYDKQSGK